MLLPGVKAGEDRAENILDRGEARTDVFDYVEMFYNAWRRHSFNNQKSPVEYARHYKMKLESVW